MKASIPVLTIWLLALLLAGCSSDEDNLVIGCIKSTACRVKAYPRVSDCVDGYHNLLVPAGAAPVYDAIYRCVVEAMDCTAVRACHGVGVSCDSAFKASCDGGKALLCDLIDKTTFTLDCAAHGLQCTIKSASGLSFDAACEGPATQGAAGAVDCGDGVCQSTTKPCTTGNDFDACDGERLEACLGNRWVSFDCAKLGLGPCQQSALWGNCGPI